jgi:hypothetical protein
MQIDTDIRAGLRSLVVIAAATLALLSSAAAADEDDAQALMKDGLQRYAAGDLTGARIQFAAAQRMVPAKPNPYRLLALVDSRLGRCQDAIDEAKTFLALAKPDDSRRAEVVGIRDECLRTMAPRVGALTVDSAPSGADVHLDREDAPSLGTTPLKVDAPIGRHAVVVSKAGFVTSTQIVDVAPGVGATVTVTLNPAPAATLTKEQLQQAGDAIEENKRRRREEAERQERDAARAAARAQRVFINVSMGTGVGYEPAGNHTEVAWQYQPQQDSYVRQPVGSGGAGIAPLHLALEFGGNVYRTSQVRIGLSAVMRLQVLTAANAETVRTGIEQGPTTKAAGAFAGLARVGVAFLSRRVHPLLHFDIGGGQIRHYLDVSSAGGGGGPPLVDLFTAQSYNMGDRAAGKPGQISEGNQLVCMSDSSCVDTVALGYFLIGGGLGFVVDLNKYVTFMMDTTLLGAIGTGDSQSGMNFDMTLGFGVRF